VGTLASVDPDAGQTHTYALVAGAGDVDNASFEIAGSTVTTKASMNYEAKSSYSVRIRTTDDGSPSQSFEKTVTIQVNDVNDAPVAGADGYGGVVGNTKATLGVSVTGEPVVALTGNVLTANDTDEDAGDAVSAVVETVASPGDGTATVNADGTFTFLPGVGDKNQADAFTYHVTDGEATTAGTVTVTIANVLVWYVNNALVPDGNGRSTTPFRSLGFLNGSDPDGPGDIIFLHQGSGPYGGGLALEASQKLFGQPHGLTSVNVTAPAGSVNPDVTNASGHGITLADGVEIQRVDVATTSGDGVTGTGIDTATIGTSLSVTGAAGADFKLTGGNGAVTFSAAITNTAGRSVDIQDRTGGSVSVAGAISDTGAGIHLNGNTGATITFSGALALNTGSSPAFTATGGGTVTVVGGSNALATTTAAALNVANPTIGANGLNFRSISANGAASGIVLSNTGSSGGLTVSGSGSSGTGGTIQNSTGAGVLLTATRSPRFSWMNVQDSGADGIRGSAVSGFASIANSTVTGSAENHLIVTDSSGSLNLTVTGSTFSNTSSLTGNDGIHLDANETAGITASVTGSTFSSNRGDHFQFATDATASGTSNVTFSNNTLTGGPGLLDAGVTISTDAGSDTSFTVANNSIQGAVSSAITIDLGTNSTAGGTLFGTISGNTIGTAAVSNSGSSQFNAITTYANGNGTLTESITGNTVRQYANFAGIDARIRAGSPTLNATITGNTIANPGVLGTNGIFVEAGAASGDGGLLCAGISDNSLTGSSANGGTDFRLRQRFNTTVRLPGYAGAAGDTAAVVAFAQGNNPGAETGSATVDFPATGNGFVGGGACPTP
jgi:large repetitive protein